VHDESGSMKTQRDGGRTTVEAYVRMYEGVYE